MGHDVPSTSKAAFKQAKEGLIDSHQEKILACFERLGNATADQVAEYLGMDHVVINRRFSELSKDGKICNTFQKKPTRKGRAAYVWSLNHPGAKTDKETKNLYLNQKSSTDYSKELIQATQTKLFT